MTGADLPSPNENISVPYGLVRTVEHYLGSIGILDHLDTFKTKGIPISTIVTAMCTHTLMGNNSMSRCSDWLSNPYVCKEMGFNKGISQRTINRALETPVTTRGEVKPYVGWTNKFIFPPHRFAIPDAIVSNFHRPGSTMLMSVAAFGGYDNVMKAYETALKEDYKFGPYGDALLII